MNKHKNTNTQVHEATETPTRTQCTNRYQLISSQLTRTRRCASYTHGYYSSIATSCTGVRDGTPAGSGD